MAYKFSETGKLSDEFRNVFGIGFKPFYDGLISVAAKQLCIDILKFDEWLHQQHGNYEDDGKSMDDIIREHYGEKGVELINEVTDMGEELTNGIVSIDGVKTVAERTVRKEQLTYKPFGNYHEGLDVNQVVYDLMTIAAHDALDCGTALCGGNYTAAEMAGTFCGMHQYVEGSDYKVVRIETETFRCTYHVSDAFAQMAEWEGVMNLSPKKYFRFKVEGKELPKGAKIEPYKRWRGYKPTTISLAAENTRIAKKFEVLGAMAKSLTSEGMRKALSVIAAASRWSKATYEVRDMAKKAMMWKLQSDYGRVPTSQPVCFTAKDFEYGPEVWKNVDVAYTEELDRHFKQMLADSPAPEWPKQGDVVVIKDAWKMAKVYQPKFICVGGVATLSINGESIVWRASVRVKKLGNEYFLPGQLEPAPDDKPKKKAASKRGKNGAGSNSSEREQARPKVKADVKPQTAAVSPQTSNELSLAERLRQALLNLNAA